MSSEAKNPVSSDVITPISSFEELPVFLWLKKALGTMGLREPTDIQKTTILAALKKRDVIGAAPTGSGKTLCFAVPILQSLAEEPQGAHSLVLTPTRELAFQIADQFRALGSSIKVRVEIIVGGIDMMNQARALSNLPHVIIATPGRLAHILENNSSPLFTLKRVKYLVLDEADRLLSPDFQKSFRQIFPHLPEKRQTLLFSATMTSDLERLGNISLKQVYKFDASPSNVYAVPEGLEQHYLLLAPTVKDAYLFWLLKKYVHLPSLIIFVESRSEAETLHLLISELGFKSTQLHSLMTQDRRIQSINRFKSGHAQILVATDVASRGLDIPSVGLVINYNVPQKPEDYVHRVGRTARAGRGGQSVVFLTRDDLQYLLLIEEIVNVKMSELEHKEEDVLLLLNKALTARQIASLHLEETGFYDKVERFDAKKRLDEGKPPKKHKPNYQKNKSAKMKHVSEERKSKTATGAVVIKRKRENEGERSLTKKAKKDA